MPDRLPSLILLVGFWIPPAAAGWAAAGFVQRRKKSSRSSVTHAVLAALVLGYAAAWFLFQLNRIPPYVFGATQDPTYAPPEAVLGLAMVAGALVLPVSTLACLLAFRRRVRMLRRASVSRAAA